MTTDPADGSELGDARAKVIVGYEGEASGKDAMSFAQQWVKAGGDQLVAVTVYPGSAPIGMGRVDAEWVAYGREEADQLLNDARTLAEPGLDISYRRVQADSAAHGIHDLLEDAANGTPLVVLGSRRARGLRRTYPGSTADRLLQGSPVPVAVVPWGYADHAPKSIEKVTVAFVDTPDGHVALEHAARMAKHLGAALDVVSIIPDTRVIPSIGDTMAFAADQRAAYQTSLDAALTQLPDGTNATGRLLEGPVIEALADLTPADTDLLVCGSRGYGPVRRVLLGGVSARLLRHARVPVIVVPRG